MSDLTGDSGGRIGPENASSACLGGSWAPLARQDVRDADRGSEGAVAAEVVHACPPGWSALTPCCGRTPFELDRWSRMTLEPENVTCRPEPTTEPSQSGPTRPAEPPTAPPASPSGSGATAGPQKRAHTCGTPPSMSCCACMDELADPFGPGPVEPEWVATARPGDTVILRVPATAEYAEVQVAALRKLNPEVTFVVLAEDCTAEMAPVGLLRWGSAADTVCEHPTEAEARSHEANTTTVHRWPDGPWVDDQGRIWEGDDQFGALHGQVFELTNEVERHDRQLTILRDALCWITVNADASPSDLVMARAALVSENEVVDEAERLREGLESLPLVAKEGDDRG